VIGIAALGAACLLLARRAPAQTNNSSEYAVKAAFLFHFAQFVEWPAGTFKDANSPLTYCTLGVDPFIGALDDTLRGKTIGERAIHVQQLRSSEPVHDCQVLFMGAVEAKRTSSLLAILKNEAILTVGESQNFAEEGGMIEFLLEGNKIRFAINLRAVNTARLKMSARLLALAKNVIETDGGN
jgi:YfiR/HmsC-like